MWTTDHVMWIYADMTNVDIKSDVIIMKRLQREAGAAVARQQPENRMALGRNI